VTTVALPLNHFSMEYYETMKATERARISVARTQNHAAPRHVRLLAEVVLWYPFYAVTRGTAKLVTLLEAFEAHPAAVLLDEEGEKIPRELQDLFRKMCLVVQQTEVVGLADGLLLKNSVTKLGEMSQQIKGYADRFADAQIKLRSRVPEDHVQAYQESFAAYANCKLTPEQFSEEETKAQLLRF
jgi:hypothetical protein